MSSTKSFFYVIMLVLLFLLVFSSTSSSSTLHQESSAVELLNVENFDSLVTNTRDVWLVEFYAPWCIPCRELTSELERAAKALVGVARVGEFNTETLRPGTDLSARLDFRTHPAIKIYGADRRKPTDCSGERLAEGFIEVVLAEFRRIVESNLLKTAQLTSGSDPSRVVELSDDNFEVLVIDSGERWLVEFRNSACPLCGNVEGQWEDLAVLLDGKISVGTVDSIIAPKSARQYGSPDLSSPALKFFSETYPSGTEYEGLKTTEDVSAWCLDRYFQDLPDPDVIEVIDRDSFETACADKSWCVVTFLPQKYTTERREKYLNTVKDLAKDFKKENWGWAWSETGVQIDLEESFGEITEFPALVVADFNELTYHLLDGELSVEKAEHFLRNISGGMIVADHIFKYDQRPQIVKVVRLEVRNASSVDRDDEETSATVDPDLAREEL